MQPLASGQSYIDLQFCGRPRAIAALRQLAALPLPLDDRVEAEALAQAFIEQDLTGTVEIVAAVYTVNNGDDLLRGQGGNRPAAAAESKR